MSHRVSRCVYFIRVYVFFNTWIQLRLVVLSSVALTYQLKKKRTIKRFVGCRGRLFGPLVNKVVYARKSYAQDL